MKLSVKQSIALDYLEDKSTIELLYGGAAGGGKSILGTYWLMKQCLKYTGSRWLMGRAHLKTLKETTLNSFFTVAQMQGLKADVHYRFNQQTNIITFINGSEILLKDLFLYPSDPNFDDLGSLEITGAFIDEANQITEKARAIVRSRIRYRLDEFGLIPKVLMTCNPAKNWVYNRFYKPHKESTLPDELKFIQALVTDNPNISKHYIANLQGLDKIDRERLLEGNWDYDEDLTRLIEYDAIVNAFNNDNVDELTQYISADVARYGSDRIVIIHWKGFRAKIYTFTKKSITETAAIIKQLMDEYSIPAYHVIVDDDGVGGGVVDILNAKPFVNNSTPLLKENYTNLKSQCYYNLAKHINEGKIAIESTPHKDLIIQELQWVKMWKQDQDGKKAVMPKEEIKKEIGRSPDFADALMMRMWFEVKPKFVLFE